MSFCPGGKSGAVQREGVGKSRVFRDVRSTCPPNGEYADVCLQDGQISVPVTPFCDTDEKIDALLTKKNLLREGNRKENYSENKNNEKWSDFRLENEKENRNHVCHFVVILSIFIFFVVF